MSAKKILTVGVELASSETEYASFSSRVCLLDWDIVLFKPTMGDFLSYHYDFYNGKPSLSDTASFELKECCGHWRREIKQAFETGKTVVIYLPKLVEVYVDTGRRSYSGTGRNQKTTVHVDLYDNYQAIPVSLSPVTATGNSMKLTPRGSEILAPYWSEFQDISQYQVLLTEANVPACLVTRTGDKPVGALYRSKASGTLLLLPDIEFYPDNFVKKIKGDKHAWTAAATRFSGRMVASIVALDKVLRSAAEATPQPAWATEDKFILGPERALRAELLDAERKVEQAEKDKERIAEALKCVGSFRALLFEKGKPLEAAIIDALRLLGFTAAPYKDSTSEFDVVFESNDGRLIGEAEGKDNKAVNIDKLRQLAMNIHEDLQRDEVKSPAKPVLFGNGFRLLPLQERADPFTEKCCTAAATSSTALVFTPDLFAPVQYMLDHSDTDYAHACRQAILSSTGRVMFPAPPSTAEGETQTESESGR